MRICKCLNRASAGCVVLWWLFIEHRGSFLLRHYLGKTASALQLFCRSTQGTCFVQLLCGFVYLSSDQLAVEWGEGGQMFMEPLWIVLGGCSCSHLPCVGSREAARECRRKKKEYVKCLENRVAVLENQNKTLIEELKALKDLYCHKAE